MTTSIVADKRRPMAVRRQAAMQADNLTTHDADPGCTRKVKRELDGPDGYFSPNEQLFWYEP